jgi:hypothetical protein
MTPGAFAGEAFHADLAGAGLDAARQPGSVLLRLPSPGDVGIVCRFIDAR